MHISFSPVRQNQCVVFEKRGDCLIIDGEAFDFSDLPNGAQLPADAVASAFVTGPVERIGGVLHLTVLLPHGADAPDSTRFAEPVTVLEDGPVPLPAFDAADLQEGQS